MAFTIPESILNQIKLATGQSLGVPWENDYKTLAGQLQSIQSQADVYKGASPLEANQHIYNIASTLARDYGIGSISDIGIRKVGEEDQYYNKKDPSKIIPAEKFASERAGAGYSNYNLEAVPDGQGGMIAVPVQQYSLSGASEFIAENRDLILLASVALQVVPGLGQAVGYAVLGAGDAIAGAALAGEIASAVGISTVTAASVVTAVGSATIAASVTAAQGGTVEDVLKAGVAAGSAVGVNFAAGGGVTGAAAGSAVGTAIQGGNASQVLTNAFAAGVGAGVQDAMPNNPDAGKILGSAARTYIATGGNIDQTLLNTAATAIGTLDQPTTYAKTTTAQPAPGSSPFQYGNDTYQELDDGTAKVTTQSGNVRILSADTFNEIKQDYATDVAAGASPPSAGAVIPPQTVAEVAPVVSPVVTDLDLVKQVAAQPTPTVDPKALEQVIVQGQGANIANVAPVETTVPSTTVPSTAAVATPTPSQPFPTPTITPVSEPEKEAPVVTDIPPVEPPQTEFERRFINETVAAPVTTNPEFQQVTVRETVPRPVEPVEFEQKTIQETVPKVSEVVTDVPAPAPPSPPAQLEEVTVRETVPKVSEVVTDVPSPPVEPPPPPAPEVKAEEPKKEEPPKKETKKLYPTVTSVPPPKRPGRQPIITGASPARLLADALAAYRPAGAIEGEESGKERQNVWNEKSLRLKDALGL